MPATAIDAAETSGRSVMSVISQTGKPRTRLRLVPARTVPVPCNERDSDCWPDWTTTAADAEARAFADRNRFSLVLADIVGALAVTAGIVALIEIVPRLFLAAAG